jgi:methionyl-tRNA formyltransferase
MRLVFCGTPQFAVPTLEAVLNAGHRVELVLTQPDRPRGRGLDLQISAVKQSAQRLGLSVSDPAKLRENIPLQQQLEQISPDAILVVAYGRLIPPWMLSLPRYGNLNLHASLLPKYRGAAPIQWAIANGETETGVTTMRIDEGLDTGDILLQGRVPIAQNQTAVELSPILAAAGAELMVRTLSAIEQNSLYAARQDNANATSAPILQREDGRVDWNRTATEIYNRWRGFQPWPGSFTFFRKKKLVLHSMQVGIDKRDTAAPGALARDGGALSVACGQGTRLEMLEVQIEGKRRMSVSAFLNGISLTNGECLG